MTRDAILNALARDRVHLEDLVGRLGSESTALVDHPEFRSCFIPGSVDERRIADLRQENRAGISLARRRRISKKVGVTLLLLTSMSLLYIGLTSRMFVLDGLVLDEISDGWSRTRKAFVPQERGAAIPAMLPQETWLTELSGSVPDLEGHPAVSLQEARALLWAGDSVSLAQARVAFLQVARAQSADPEALAGLTEVLVADREGDPDWVDAASRAMARLDAVAETSMTAHRAKAALALGEGNDTLALKLTQECAVEDLGCALIRGEANGDLTGLQEIGELYPDSARIHLAIGRVAFRQQMWPALYPHAVSNVAQWPQDGAAWAMLAEAYAATGHWVMAEEAALRAIELHPWRVESQHLLAAVHLWFRDDAAAALDAYQHMMGMPGLDRYSGRLNVLVQGGIAALRQGEYALAAEWADAALAEASENPAAKLVRAAVYQAQEQGVAAQGVLRSVDHSLLAGPAGARMHFWAGAMFLDLGQQRLARTELEAAGTEDPHWAAPRMELAWAKLASGDALGASEEIRALGWYSPRLERKVALRERVDLGDMARRDWRKLLIGAMSADVRLALKQEGTLAVLDWYEGQPGAAATLQSVVALGDGDLNLQAALAQALLDDGEPKRSLVVAERVLASRRRSGLFHGLRGQAEGLLGNTEASAASFRLALKYSGDHPTVLWWTLRARERQGDAAGTQAVIDTMTTLGIDTPTVQGVLVAQASSGE